MITYFNEFWNNIFFKTPQQSLLITCFSVPRYTRMDRQYRALAGDTALNNNLTNNLTYTLMNIKIHDVVLWYKMKRNSFHLKLKKTVL